MKNYILRQLFPFLTWYKDTPNSWKNDLIAGFIVAIVAIPQALAYAQTAGVPAYYGLYAACLPVVIAALWGSSYHLVGGPAAVVSILTLVSISNYVKPFTPEFVSTAAALALLVGTIQLIIGALQLGNWVRYISHPVVTGFINAAVIIIALSQLPKLLGLPSSHSEQQLVVSIGSSLLQFKDVHIPTLLIGTISVLVIVVLRKLLNSTLVVPALIVIATIGAYYFNYNGPVVGQIPQGLPPFTLPSFAHIPISKLIFPAFLIAIIGYVESTSIAKALAIKTKQRIHANQNLIAEGLANTVAGLQGTIPVAGSFSRSIVNFESGAKTPLSSIFATIIVISTVLWFTSLLYYLPQAVLAAVIFASIFKLMTLKKITHMWRTHRGDMIVAMITFMASFWFAPRLDYGILVGILVSFSLYLYRIGRPRITIFNCADHNYINTHNFKFELYPTNKQVLAVIIEQSWMFTNAEYFEQKITKSVITNPHIRHVLLMSRAVNYIDITACEVLSSLINTLKDRGVDIYFSGLKQTAKTKLEKAGIINQIGEDHIMPHANEVLHSIANQSPVVQAPSLRAKHHHTQTRPAYLAVATD